MWLWRQQIESPAEDEKYLPQLTRIQTTTTLRMASITCKYLIQNLMCRTQYFFFVVAYAGHTVILKFWNTRSKIFKAFIN